MYYHILVAILLLQLPSLGQNSRVSASELDLLTRALSVDGRWYTGTRNDVIFNEDDYYTCGINIGFQWKGKLGLWSWLPGAASAHAISHHVSWEQHVFTPYYAYHLDKPSEDLPFSSQWMFQKSVAVHHDKWLQAWTLGVGVIGPSGGGEWLQNNVHKLANLDETTGWSKQIEQQTLFQSTYQIRYQYMDHRHDDGFGLDGHVAAVAHLGTAIRQVALGGQLRLGGRPTSKHAIAPSLFVDRSIGESVSANTASAQHGSLYLAGYLSSLDYVAFMDEPRSDGTELGRDDLLMTATIGYRFTRTLWTVDLSIEAIQAIWEERERNWDLTGGIVLSRNSR